MSLPQFDSMPDNGRTPLPGLKPGYVLRDRIVLAQPENAEVNPSWHIQIGLYDAAGTFIRAFIEPDESTEFTNQVFAGQCSPEYVNVTLLAE